MFPALRTTAPRSALVTPACAKPSRRAFAMPRRTTPRHSAPSSLRWRKVSSTTMVTPLNIQILISAPQGRGRASNNRSTWRRLRPMGAAHSCPKSPLPRRLKPPVPRPMATTRRLSFALSTPTRWRRLCLALSAPTRRRLCFALSAPTTRHRLRLALSAPTTRHRLRLAPSARLPTTLFLWLVHFDTMRALTAEALTALCIHPPPPHPHPHPRRSRAEVGCVSAIPTRWRTSSRARPSSCPPPFERQRGWRNRASLSSCSPSSTACCAATRSKCPPGSARGRLPRLLRARLAALAGPALPRERPAHWAPSHCLGCSSEPRPKPPIAPPLTLQARRL